MTLRERLKAVTNNFAWEQDWNIQEYAVHKRDIDYRRGKADAYGDVVHRLDEVLEEFPEEPVGNPDKMNLDNVIRNLESDEAVCRSHGEDDYFKGMADGYKLSIDALKWLSGNPDKMTLKELARKLRKIFRFKYLTACYKMTAGSRIGLDLFIGPKPDFTHDGYWANNYVVAGGSLVIPADLLDIPLDLSEYKDADGNIDYSKCIVEVE